METWSEIYTLWQAYVIVCRRIEVNRSGLREGGITLFVDAGDFIHGNASKYTFFMPKYLNWSSYSSSQARATMNLFYIEVLSAAQCTYRCQEPKVTS